jgi:beta-lactam-binding protein with PASTA domain
MGMPQDQAARILTGAGFQVTAVTQPGSAAKGTVQGTTPNGSAIPGSVITLLISDGLQRQPPPMVMPPPNVPGLPQIPRLPPIPIPIPIPIPN